MPQWLSLQSKQSHCLSTVSYILKSSRCSGVCRGIFNLYSQRDLPNEHLQRDKIDETMDAMASANADARDIDEAIRTGVAMAQSEAGIDDGELEEELAALVAEAEDEKKVAAARKEERETEAILSILYYIF